MPIKIAMISLGCPKNQVNAEEMLFSLKENGFSFTDDPASADVAIVNTCGFIESAVQEGITQILELSELKKANGSPKIIATGCIPERYRGEMMREIPELDAVLGTGSYGAITDAVRAVLTGHSFSAFGDVDAPDFPDGRILSTALASAYLKIAEGCNNHCAYCVIPTLRGKFRSRPMDAILAEANKLVKNGVRELILVAQDLTRYGTDFSGRRMLSELLQELCQIEDLHWIRLHYLYPDEIDDELLETIAKYDKIVKYFDIPIQHADDRILKAMNRRGNRAFLSALFHKIRSLMPDAVLRTSVIVGFPGEDESAFENLCTFMRETKMERVGVFAFSREEGSAAYHMPNQVEEDLKQKRVETLYEIQYGILADFNEKQVGKKLTVLCEGYDPDEALFYGRSYMDSIDIDCKVFFNSMQKIPAGTFQRVLITGVLGTDLLGEICQEA